jgi:hypothetical protein
MRMRYCLLLALVVSSCQRDRTAQALPQDTLLPKVSVLQHAAPSKLPQMQTPSRDTLATGPVDFSCSAFPSDLSEADLIDRFGAENVRAGPVTGSDNGPSDGTIVSPKGTDGTLWILWRDTARRAPNWVRAKSGKVWRTSNGISLAMKLKAIEQANGKPFRLRGFRTENSGNVVSWEGGRLELPANGDCTLKVQFYPEYETGVAKGCNEVARNYLSDHPAMQCLDPPVVALWLTYAR